MAPKKKQLTAVKKLELSKLNPNEIQREMMGKDLDLEKLVVYLKSQILFDAVDRVVDVTVNRAIDEASTVDVVLNDYDRSIIRSWAINAKLDINIDGLWFRLVSCSRTAGDDNLTLTFEQREIALLRSYPKPDTNTYTKANARHWVKWASRDKGTTRAEFILNLIREVKEVDIPVVIPHLHQTQPIVKNTDLATPWTTGDNVASSSGIDPNYNKNKASQTYLGVQAQVPGHKKITAPRPQPLKVKTARATPEQIRNANTILTVGVQKGARRKVLVASIMVAIDESTIHNLAGGDRDSVGVFQQRDSWGSYDDRHDVATSAGMFFDACMKVDAAQPGQSFNDLCQNTQHSGTPLAYGQYRWEAEAFCNAFGIPPGGEGDAITGGSAGSDPTTEGSAATANSMGQTWTNPGTDGTYYFYRGIPPTRNKGWWKREDNWTCIKRLADEVGWRAFFIGGVFYFLTDDDLFKTQPIATVTEETPGVMGIGFDYDVGRKGATVDLPCQVGLWSAPPGSVIVIEELGPLDGRWLVNTYSRSLFDDNADIALTKPQPKLREPTANNVSIPTWSQPQTPAAPNVNGPHPNVLQQIIPKRYLTSIGGLHPTEGLPDYEAMDWMAPSGSPVVAPEAGKVHRFSGYNPELPPPLGIHGPYGLSLYMLGESGTDYYMTHLGAYHCSVGDKVFAGQLLAQVGDYAQWGGADHCHCGLHNGTVTNDMLRHALPPADPTPDAKV